MGGSIGGALAIDFAVEHPDAVAKLVLVDPQAFASLPPSPDKPPPLPAPLGFVGAAVLKSVPLRFLATRMVHTHRLNPYGDVNR
jgi:pimeloyl-ACP methyl ester carboxylesterase